VSDNDRSYILKHASLLAYPSIYEGFGLPILEAMATKTPIVTSKEGSLEEIGADAVEFVDAYSN
jgi:glycosyltransferase involved in cell wall biosynthesis